MTADQKCVNPVRIKATTQIIKKTYFSIKFSIKIRLEIELEMDLKKKFMEGKINCEQFSYSEQRALTPMKAETVTHRSIIYPDRLCLRI